MDLPVTLIVSAAKIMHISRAARFCEGISQGRGALAQEVGLVLV